MKRIVICLVLISSLFTSHVHADDSQSLAPVELKGSRSVRMVADVFLAAGVMVLGLYINLPKPPRFVHDPSGSFYWRLQ